MQYDIKILDFTKDVQGFRIGTCDVQINYQNDKWEIFRNIGVFNKDDKQWISFPKTKRTKLDEATGQEKDVWLPTYERSPPLDKEMYDKILSKLEL